MGFVRFAGAVALLLLASPAIAVDAPEAGGGPGAAPLKDCKTDLKYLNSITGWQIIWPREWKQVDEAPDQANPDFFAEWALGPRALEQDEAALRAGLGTIAAAPRSAVQRVLDQVASLEVELDHGEFARGAWASDPKRRAMIAAIRPAVEKYRLFLANEYLPRASSGSGLPQTAEGRQCFARAVEKWTGLNPTVPQIEQTGWRILKDTDRELLKTAGVPASRKRALLDKLRTSEPNEHVTGDDIVRISQAALRRAEAKLPGWFIDIPRAEPLAVEPMDAAMAVNAPAGSYSPKLGGRLRAVYEVNTSRPADRRLMAEVIAFHEGVPGHHLAALASHGEGGFDSGFGEGWAIYAEYLADEMGLYSTKRDRMGMMAKHLWAASRLVVEPGLHVHGWSRDQAIRFMLDHTALPQKEIEIEVDRYISMPGQSLSYMLGYDRFHAMRERAQAALGPKFNLPRFNQVLLRKGMRDLDDVDKDVTAWIASEQVAPGTRAG
jgi:uncharacterized protein (DUF885 family)